MAAAIGNQYAAKDRKWAKAIERALAKKSLVAQRDALEEIADALLAKAADGDMVAIKELGDRLDGKPAQTISGDPDAPLQTRLIISG